MKKDTLQQIAEILLQSNSALLYPHLSVDGDALGSSVALCRALRKQGKEAYILVEDEIPTYLSFLDQGFCTCDQEIIAAPDLSIAVDCSDVNRFKKRKHKFFQGKIRICLDHHKTNNAFADFNYIDESAAATSEIIFELIKEAGIEMDAHIAEAIYTAIVTDTGNFQYTNTRKKTHLIVAELFDIGFNLEKVGVEIYQNVRPEKLMIAKDILGTLEMFCENRANLAYCTQQMLRENGAKMDETEGSIEMLRSLRGVEISAFLKEEDTQQVKVSLRSKTYGDVAAIAESFGGGGHTKAAGCTLHCSLRESIALIRQAVTFYLQCYDQKAAEKDPQENKA